MSYLKIPNLYKDQSILLFKKCYAMEKIHGTSAHISFTLKQGYTDGFGVLVPEIKFFAGGEKHENFVKLFNEVHLSNKFSELGVEKTGFETQWVIFGEAYGGKCQGMSDTYGKELKFIAFEVKIDDNWLSAPQAEDVCKQLGLDFVHYEEVETNIELLDKICAADSIQAIRNGVGTGKLREGIVLRPLIELTKNNGDRIIAKHKNEQFKEREHVPKVRPDRLEVLTKANEIADEWVTDMRLTHVLDAFPDADITKTGEIVKAMIEDVLKEGEDEIIDSKEAKSAIGRKTAVMFKQRLRRDI